MATTASQFSIAIGMRLLCPRRWTHSSASTSRVRLLCRMAVARANAAAPAHCRIRSDFVEPVWKPVLGGRARPPFAIGGDAYLRAASRNGAVRGSGNSWKSCDTRHRFDTSAQRINTVSPEHDSQRLEESCVVEGAGFHEAASS